MDEIFGKERHQDNRDIPVDDNLFLIDWFRHDIALEVQQLFEEMNVLLTEEHPLRDKFYPGTTFSLDGSQFLVLGKDALEKLANDPQIIKNNPNFNILIKCIRQNKPLILLLDIQTDHIYAEYPLEMAEWLNNHSYRIKLERKQ